MTDALGLAARVRDGEVSARELAEESIARIEATNPQLNFLVTDCFEQALAGEPRDGPFSGVPILIKDLNETAGVRTTFSSRMFAEYVPMHDSARRSADQGRRLRRARQVEHARVRQHGDHRVGAERRVSQPVEPGAHAGRLVGRCGRGGRRRHDAARARLRRRRVDSNSRVVLRALRHQAVARPRLPAPYVSGSLELSQSGPLSVSVRDAAAFLDAIAGYESGDAHWATPPVRPFLDEVGADPGRLRIAFTAEPPIPHEIDPRVVAVARSAADALSALGHEVIEGGPDWSDEALLGGFAKLWQVGPAMFPVSDLSLLEPLNRALAEAAHETSSVVFAQAVAGLALAARRIVSFWDDVDIVLTPGLGKLPVPIGWVFEPDDPWEQFRRGGEFTPFTPIVNVTGQPAAMVPFDVVDGLPVGVQLIGKPEGEAMLFRLAAQLEEAHPWASRISSAPW